MKRKFLIKGTLLMLLFMMNIGLSAQSFIISFPNFSPGPAQNPQGLTICNGNSLLQVQLDAAAASTTGASITVQLPTGIEYVPGSITTVSSTAALTISEDGGTANAPKFKIDQSVIAVADRIVFTLRRSAACAARTFILGGGTFRDSVSATIGGATTSENSSTYQVDYPVFSFIQPATQTNAVVGGNYTRTFTINNGGNGCATAVHFSVDYPSNGIQQTSLKLTSVNGTALGAPVTLTPTSTVGTTSYYTITSANLPGGDFCNGESLTITEGYTVKSCGGVTNYATGWGCSSAPADWCQTVSGTGSIAVATGVPDFTAFTAVRSNFVDACTQFNETFTFKNGGSGNVSAATMFNAKLRLGGTTSALLGAFDWSYINILSGSIGGQPVTIVGGTSNGIASIDLNNFFTTDPDGAGVGLEDIDGDGFFDDLPAGNTITLTTIIKLKCDRFICNAERNTYYNGVYADIQYNSMCAPTVLATSTKLTTGASNGIGFGQVAQLADKSFAPANIDNGVPFKARFSMGYYRYDDSFDTSNTRHLYEITLPTGLTLSGAQPTVVWHRGQYPSNSGSTAYSATVTQVGNVITVTSPDDEFGWFELNFVYDCAVGPGGSGISVPYKVKKINNILTGCVCNAEIFCDDLTLGMVHCPSPCSAGPSITTSKVEREDSSLGWADNTLTTRQARASITDYDLSKMLNLDDFFVKANAVQNGPSTNLHLYYSIIKDGGTNDKISAKSIEVVIKRGAATVGSGTITASTNTGTTTTLQVVDWDLTSLLPAGGLLSGDVIETISHYSVITNTLPTLDIQTGKEMYFYNLDAGNNKISCNVRIPEMYLVGTIYTDSHNGGQALNSSACSAYNVGVVTNAIARRFSAAGTKYLNEVRPGILPTKYTVTVDNSYAVNSVTLTGDDVSATGIVLTPNSVVGNTYTFNLDPKTYPITVTNTYNVIFTVNISPTCATPANAPTGLVSQLEYIDYYYHYKDVVPTVAPSIGDKTLVLTYDTSTRPTITISDETGTIQASKPSESFIIKMASTGTSTAPYTWLSIPTTAGVNVTQLVDVATNAVLSPITYAGGVWFKIDPAGLASGTFKNYRLDFTYTTCNPTTFQVEGGWNCTAYPSDPSTYMCGKSTVDLTFIPQNGEVQIITVTQPTAPINLCTPLDYEFRINSASAGNIVGNKFSITLPQGLSYVGAVQAEYPVGSGNWQTVTQTVAGNVRTLDLTTHTFFPVQGLPGTLTDGGVANLRLMGIKFQTITDCTFVVGSNIVVSTKADKTCGVPAIGDGVELAANSIAVIGANPPYQVVSAVTVQGGFGTCTTPIVANIQHTIITNTSTTATGYAKVYIPTGYTYTAGSFACTSASCPTYAGLFTDPLTSEQYLRFNIPGGLPTGTILNYDLGFVPTATVATGSYTLKVVTVDEISGLSCPSAPGGTCSSVLVQTGATSFNYTLACACYDLPNTATAGVATNHGITLLQRAGIDNGNWPMIRKSGHTVLESNTKGFVITRMTTAEITAIASPQEGMMVYDTVAKCLKLYDGTVWSCFVTPTCP